MSKFKEMTFKNKMIYIWDYYKIKIGGVLLVLGIAASFIYGQSNKINYTFNTVIIDSGLTEETRLNLENYINDNLIKSDNDKDREKVSYNPINNSGEEGTVLMIKFLAELASGGIDLIVSEENQLDNLIEQGALLDLSTIDNLTKDKEELLVYNNENKAYSLSIETSSVLKEMGYNTDNKVISITSTSENVNLAIEGIKLLIK